MKLPRTLKRKLELVAAVAIVAYFFLVLFSYLATQVRDSVLGNAVALVTATPAKESRSKTPPAKTEKSPTPTLTRSLSPTATSTRVPALTFTPIPPTATTTRTTAVTPIAPTATITRTTAVTPIPPTATITKTNTATFTFTPQATFAKTNTATFTVAPPATFAPTSPGVLPTPSASAIPSPTKNISVTFTATLLPTVAVTVLPSPTPTMPPIEFGRVLKGLGVSDHSVSPSTRVDVQVSVTTQASIASATLTDFIPRAWTVADAGGGALVAVNADTQKIDWSVGNLSAGAIVTKTYTLISPGRTTPSPQYQFSAALTNSNGKYQSNVWQVLLEHPLAVKHYRIGKNTLPNQMTFLAATDAPGRGLQQFESFRVRFAIANDQPSPVSWKPRLEWSARADSGFQLVTPGKTNAGQPFYVRPLDGIQNRQTIPASLFGLGSVARTPQDGFIFTADNPAPLLTLNSQSSTEIEFSVHTTLDSAFSTTYYFRLTDDDRQMIGKVAQIDMGAPAPVQLTQPQYPGIAPNLSSAAAPALRQAVQAPAATSPHGSYSNLADQCASCHRQHTGQNRNLLAFLPAQSRLCFACHNGTGASTNIASQYSDPNVPADNATTSTFYSHPATVTTNHTNANNDEFKGVLNRHSECGDCHNPHSGDASLATSTANGFTTSGALKNIPGVGANGAWKPVSTFDYELCIKCHSNYTTLLSYTKPSYKMLDQAAEFNPANASFHPIENAGKNNTTAMTASLAGTSPYKLWNFTVGSVIRCENCHGDYRLADPASPPAANARLAPHTSKFANILMNNYRDRVLKPAGENYSAADFALCFQCHAEAPFAPGGGSSTATNFRLHSYHLTNIGGRSSASNDIDTLGAGQGRAICAECHYRVHGQGINAPGNPGGTRLVNFAPNVTASGGQLKWDPAARTCYVNCHGDNHSPERY